MTEREWFSTREFDGHAGTRTYTGTAQGNLRLAASEEEHTFDKSVGYTWFDNNLWL